MKHRRQWNGVCLDCRDDHRAGGDWPVCSHPEPAEDDEPLRGLCANCGHEVTE